MVVTGPVPREQVGAAGCGHRVSRPPGVVSPALVLAYVKISRLLMLGRERGNQTVLMQY